MSERAATAKAKIKCTDHHGNVAYLHNGAGSFRCVLANGISAGMSYAVGTCDEVALAQRMSDALDDPDRLLAIVREVATNRRVEMFSYTPAPRAETSAKDLMKALVLTAPKAVVHTSEDGTTYTGREMAAEIDADSKLAADFTRELMTSGLHAMRSRAELALDQLPAPGMGR